MKRWRKGNAAERRRLWKRQHRWDRPYGRTSMGRVVREHMSRTDWLALPRKRRRRFRRAWFDGMGRDSQAPGVPLIEPRQP